MRIEVPFAMSTLVSWASALLWASGLKTSSFFQAQIDSYICRSTSDWYACSANGVSSEQRGSKKEERFSQVSWSRFLLTGLRELILIIPSQLCIQRTQVDSLQSALVGGFTPRKLVNTTKHGSPSPSLDQSWMLAIY